MSERGPFATEFDRWAAGYLSDTTAPVNLVLPPMRAAWQARADLAAEREAQKDARIARLEQGLSRMPGKYEDDPEAATNFAADLIAEHPRQSAAAIKVEVLREARNGLYRRQGMGVDPIAFLEDEADRIRREANERANGTA